jgi:hypothetical protein
MNGTLRDGFDPNEDDDEKTETIDVPHSMVGLIIGKSGETIREKLKHVQFLHIAQSPYADPPQAICSLNLVPIFR